MLKINSAIMDLFYPVGTYYETSNVDFDPNVAWGGTWVLDSQGKVTVSQDTTDSDFATVGATFGEKKHTLTVDEMPSHNHPVSLSGSAISDGGAIFSNWETPATRRLYNGRDLATFTGGGQAHNNVQPSVVVKRWHRTA